MYLLKDLWNGNINPSEQYAQRGSTYRKLADEATTCMDQLIAELSPKGAEILERFVDKNMEQASISEEDAFIRGVRIGARFMLDVLGDYKSQLSQTNET